MNKQLLNEAIKCLAIRDVILAETSVSVKKEYDPIYSPFNEISVQFRSGVTGAEGKTYEDSDSGTQVKLIVFTYECAFRLLPPAVLGDKSNSEEHMKAETLMEAIATFRAYYTHENDISEDAVNEFMKYNVGYHVWPYWREYASSIAMRVRLPSFSVPFYRVPE